MNIIGTVRIDLSGYVEDSFLLLSDHQVRQIHRHVVGSAPRYLVDIGQAGRVEWDPRLVMLLAAADEVTICGLDDDGVAQAASAFEAALASVPGPRSAS